MREEMEKILKEELRVLALRTRARLGLKQSEMAEKLVMCDTSYSDIETGVYKCGTLTAILLLLEQPDSNDVLQTIKQKLSNIYQEEELEL